jgi:hypothetical protein
MGEPRRRRQAGRRPPPLHVGRTAWRRGCRHPRAASGGPARAVSGVRGGPLGPAARPRGGFGDPGASGLRAWSDDVDTMARAWCLDRASETSCVWTLRRRPAALSACVPTNLSPEQTAEFACGLVGRRSDETKLLFPMGARTRIRKSLGGGAQNMSLDVPVPYAVR